MFIKILKPDLNSYFKKNNKKRKQIKKNINLLNLNEYDNGKEKSLCLNYFTCLDGYQKINYKTGDLDVTNWRTVYHNLKYKKIKLNNIEVNCSKLQKLLKHSKSGTLEIWNKEEFILNNFRKETRKLETDPKNINLQKITELWNKRKLIKDKFIRKSFKKIIYAYISWKYNITIKNYWIRIPFSNNINKLEVKKGIIKF